jgi:hypothetical protein
MCRWGSGAHDERMLSHEHLLTVLITDRQNQLRQDWRRSPASRERRSRSHHRFPRRLRS